MKRIGKFAALIIAIVLFVIALTACSGSSNGVRTLNSPRNLAIQGKTLSWNASAGAVGYEVKIVCDKRLSIIVQA